MQIDILICNQATEYNIQLGRTHSFDVILKDRICSNNLHVYNLTSKQSIYGEELNPNFLRLKQSTDFSLDVSLIEEDFLCYYDDKCLNLIDGYNLFSMDNGRGHNYIVLQNKALPVSQIIYSSTSPSPLQLESGVDVGLSKLIRLNTNRISISPKIDIDSIVGLNTNPYSMRFTDKIFSDMSQNIGLIIDRDGLCRLVLSEGVLSANCYIRPQKHSITVCTSPPEIANKLSIRNENTWDLCMHTDIALTNTTICECPHTNMRIQERECDVSTTVYLDPDNIKLHLADNIANDIHTNIGVVGVAQVMLNTTVADNLELYYGLGKYDRKLLCYWDDYAVSDMATEIIN